MNGQQVLIIKLVCMFYSNTAVIIFMYNIIIVQCVCICEWYYYKTCMYVLQLLCVFRYDCII